MPRKKVTLDRVETKALLGIYSRGAILSSLITVEQNGFPNGDRGVLRVLLSVIPRRMLDYYGAPATSELVPEYWSSQVAVRALSNGSDVRSLRSPVPYGTRFFYALTKEGVTVYDARPMVECGGACPAKLSDLGAGMFHIPWQLPIEERATV